MRDYEERHPKTAAHLYKAMHVTYDGTEAGRIAMMAELPMAAFTLVDRDGS